MSDINKWKTMPCKYCLLKGKCSESCFEWPSYSQLKTYALTNHLTTTCLICGTHNVNRYLYVQWNCENCFEIEGEYDEW